MVTPAASAWEARHDGVSELMERYARGDEHAFPALYRSLAPRLHRFCMRLTTLEAEADDCFQETFLKLHRARATYVAGMNALHWSFAIARSVYLTRLRYWRRRPEKLGAASDVAQSDLPSGDPRTPEADALADDLAHLVTVELRKMSEKNRSAYVLLKEEGLSAKEAAAVLGTTGEAVRQRAHRAYEQLKAALHDAGWRDHETWAA